MEKSYSIRREVLCSRFELSTDRFRNKCENSHPEIIRRKIEQNFEKGDEGPVKYESLNARVTHYPQSLSKSHGEPQLKLTRSLLECLIKLRDINFPLGLHIVISFVLGAPASLKQLSCLEFL